MRHDLGTWLRPSPDPGRRQHDRTGETVTILELYIGATLGAAGIWIFVPGPIDTRALLVFQILARAQGQSPTR